MACLAGTADRVEGCRARRSTPSRQTNYSPSLEVAFPHRGCLRREVDDVFVLDLVTRPKRWMTPPAVVLTETMPRDLVMTSAHIWGDVPGAIGIGDGHIVSHQIGPRTEVIDATRMTVVPGFQDAHVHTPFAGLNLLRVWLNVPTAARSTWRSLPTRRSPPGRSGSPGAVGRYRSSRLGTPARRTWMRSCPDRPVFLFNRDVHGAWFELPALDAAGITTATPDPPRRPHRRDPTGEPTGTCTRGGLLGQ